MSSNNHIRITKAGHYLPPNILDNDFFESLDIGTNDKWIVERTGIEKRQVCIKTKEDILRLKNREVTIDELRWSGGIELGSEMIAKAYEHLAKKFPDTDSEKMTSVFWSSCFPDYDIPSNASLVAKSIGASKAFCMDFNTACSGFGTSMKMIGALLKDEPNQKIGLGICDRPSTRSDFADRGSCILFGDSAAFFCIENSSKVSGFEILDVTVNSDPMSWEKVTLPMGEFFRQDGKVVQKFAVKKTIDSTKKILKKNNYSIDDLAYFIGHQANFRMVDFAAKSLEVPEEKHLYNVDRCGNQGAAGASVVLSENWGRFKHDDLVVLTVVGGGLTWSSVLMRYQEDSNK